MPILKDLLVIGDSISIHYGPWLESYVKDYFIYDRRGGGGKVRKFEPRGTEINTGDSRSTLLYVKKILVKGYRPDLLVMNCGLHDLKTDSQTGKKQVPLKTYGNNLTKIFAAVRKTKIPLIWIRTTPVVDNIHNQPDTLFHRYHQDVLEYNKAAAEIAAEHGVPEIDLFAFTERLNEDMDVYCDHVHFQDHVRMLQAAFIAGHILALSTKIFKQVKL